MDTSDPWPFPMGTTSRICSVEFVFKSVINRFEISENRFGKSNGHETFSIHTQKIYFLKTQFFQKSMETKPFENTSEHIPGVILICFETNDAHFWSKTSLPDRVLRNLTYDATDRFGRNWPFPTEPTIPIGNQLTDSQGTGHSAGNNGDGAAKITWAA